MKKLYLMCLLLIAVMGVQAQTRTFSGRVLDAGNSDPLIGAAVTLQGSTTGSITDVNGKFSLNVPAGNVTLVVKYVGYADQTVTFTANDQDVTVKLAVQQNALEDVVVVGFGTIKRRDLTGAVASVKASDIVRAPTHNPLEAIQGRASGVDITRSSGAAGAGVNVQIRGTRSIPNALNTANGINPNAPLLVVDGVQNGGNINNINPNDIESIEVLQDASSTAIYGSQGANGVIIVTTKKGISGKAKVSYNGYYGVNGWTQFPQPRQGESYINLRRESFRLPDGTIPNDATVFPNAGELQAIQAGQTVNWMDLSTRNGQQQSHTVSVRGGNDNTKAFFSLGYFNEQGQLRNQDYNRYNFRYNIDQKINNWIKAGIVGQLAFTKTNARRDPLSNALTAFPFGVPFNADGSVKTNPLTDASGNPVTGFLSPLTDERAFAAVDEAVANEINATAFVELNPIKGLTFRSNLGTVLGNSRRGVFNDAQSLTQANPRYSEAYIQNNNTRYYNWDNVLTYTRDIKKHGFTATVLSSYIHSDGESVEARGRNQTINAQTFYGLLGTDPTTRTISAPYTRFDLLAYAGRFNYSYDGKYLLQATMRWDGASRLAPGNKWDSFPSVSAGWVLSREDFMKNVSQLNNLKLRASYGISGNSTIPPYGTQSLLVPIQMGFGNVGVPAYAFGGDIVSPNLGWEKSKTIDIGLDVTAFNSRVTAAIDWYLTKTSDLLFRRSLPQSTGQQFIYQNIASTQNSGINITLTTVNIQTKDFKWSSTATFSHNAEKITGLIDGRNILSTTNPERESLFIGSQVQSFYTYRKTGIWQLGETGTRFGSTTGTQYQPGDIKVQDLNNDGVIDATNDRTVIGHAQPRWFGGFQNTFTYKNFDLNVFMVARYGQTVYGEFLGRYDPSGAQNGPDNFDYWTPTNPTNDFPKPGRGNLSNLYNNNYQSLLFIDGSFLKIKNVSLGYTFPKSLTDRIKIGTLRAYATASNMFTFTKNKLLRDYDPERGGAESSPLSRQLVFGVNVDF
ncbi:SusC/RagA family TonB-linked outer membrane protein [Mucilaginibacter aquatilis]|uniref:SusC/RagA family TonB-linked outer membrane protein n=1 Tax=Mucilaginibacter aquatilis TaxID=1517760 RepID=A0A6I4IRH0_9SPHI|nr:TonB-dependent receptor [Mucilaginibacter aquatilis]MVN92864.1 SusC/RagA family TonB-linked outer membrane protein [Mucilaginibacter aquatilis]